MFVLLLQSISVLIIFILLSIWFFIYLNRKLLNRNDCDLLLEIMLAIWSIACVSVIIFEAIWICMMCGIIV